MSNILGENHLPYVQEQIKTRQSILGKPTRDPKDQVWANGRDSWVRLVSSVNISSQQIYQLQQTGSNTEDQSLVLVSDSGSEKRNDYLKLKDYSGNDLAKELILHGGTSNFNTLKFGITQTTSSVPSNPASYGFGGTDFGINPMPGIIGFNSKTYNNGSLRKAEVSILAHNKKQFEYIESIYLRLGYTMLLEWGNSTYPKDVNTYATKGDISNLTLKGEFLRGGNNSQFFYTKIEEKREESKGNYDAFLATVENFSWNFTTSGTYEISLRLISKGSIAESLKIALPSETITTPGSKDNIDEQSENALITTIETLGSPEPLNPKEDDTIDVPWLDGFSLWGLLSSKVSNINYKPVRKINDKAVSCCAIFGNSKFVKYIRFKTLLDSINKNLLIYSDEDTPLIKIDTSEDLYGYSNTYSISSDPSKMIVKFNKKILDKEINIFSGKTTINDNEINLNIEDFHTKINDVEVCNIMNLYFSTDYLISEVKNNVDDENNLSLYKFIENLLSTANNLLGGVNKFRLRLADKVTNFDPNTNLSDFNQVLEIYDEVQPYNKEKILKNPNLDAIFRIGLGVNAGSQGSFVTDYNLSTEISKNLSTMIAIGAQAGGQAVGEDATMFSKWNLGLVDRIVPKKLDKDSLENQRKETAAPLERLQKLTKLYSSTLQLFFNTENQLEVIEEDEEGEDQAFTGYGFPDVNLISTEGEENFTKFIQIQSNWFRRSLAFDAITKKSYTPTIGFLPINLSLTLDGLSGIKIFDKLKIDTSFLPTNYGDTLEFIITELDHYLESNKWYTKIGTQSIPNTFNFTTEQQARINLEKLYLETLQFSDEEVPTVGADFYPQSSLAIALNSTYFNSQRNEANRNIPGNYKLPIVGAKNQAQKAEAFKAVSPMSTIGKLGGNFKVNQGKSWPNVKMSSQGATWKPVYQSQYDGNYYLARPAADALRNLVRKAQADGISFTITSAYRNQYHSEKLYKKPVNVNPTNEEISAHLFGGAIDIGELYTAADNGKQTPGPNSLVRENNQLYKWLDENGPKFGWYNPARLRDNKGKQEECWHWEFWGTDNTKYSFTAYGEKPNGTQDRPNYSFTNKLD